MGHASQTSDRLNDETCFVSLLQSVALQDTVAFETLYKATSRKLYGLAYRITLDHSLSEEVIGDTYLQIWQQAVSFNPSRASALGWMMMLCRSRAIDLLRKRSRQLSLHTGQDVVSLFGQSNETDQPFDIIDTMESHSALHKAMATLDKEERQLLGLAYFRDYSHSELAQLTGLPLGTVKTKLRRSIKQLSILIPCRNPSLSKPIPCHNKE